MTTLTDEALSSGIPEEAGEITVRFAGDSGDGMQLAGTQFTNVSAVFGNDVSTFPDYPSEIRAPAGTLAGVSGFQVHFGSAEVRTPGDRLDALLAMNPAALKVNIADLREGGVLIVNRDEFTPQNLKRARFEQNPLESSELHRYRVYAAPITSMTLAAVRETGLGTRDAQRCRNFFALGVVYWLYDRLLDPTLEWIQTKFGKMPAVAQANTLALRAGYHYAETSELFPTRYRVPPAQLPPGRYRSMTGNQAAALGLMTAAKLAGKPLFYGSYPITPASEILHDLAVHKQHDVRTFQAEDEIAAMCATIGASFAGAIAATGTSGPGMALKQEAIGLAVMTELPMVIVNVQRGGPSTGLPTKTEQSDLWQAVMGRNGDCPLPVVAAQSSADCYWTALEAVRVAVKYMTPVVVLTDGYLANGAEPWRIPAVEELAPISVDHPTNPAGFRPYARDDRLARPWAIPGTPGLEHRVGGLEKDATGAVSHDGANHERMTELRAAKVAGVVADVPDQQVFGPASGSLLVVSWGGTFGAVRSAIERMHARGDHRAAHAHLRWLNPMPANIGAVLASYGTVLVCELNAGQLRALLAAHYGVKPLGYHKVQGKPLRVDEVEQRINALLDGERE